MEKEQILERLTMQQVLEFYTPRKITKNRCACPIHNGKDNNFVLYDNSFYCWVCHAAGDLIKFVSLLFGLDFKATVAKLNYDFNLGIGSQKLTIREREQAKLNLLAKQAEQKAKEKKRKQADDEYWAVFDEFARLDLNYIKYRPKSAEEALNPLFVEACNKLEYQKELLSEMDVKRAGGI